MNAKFAFQPTLCYEARKVVGCRCGFLFAPWHLQCIVLTVISITIIILIIINIPDVILIAIYDIMITSAVITVTGKLLWNKERFPLFNMNTEGWYILREKMVLLSMPLNKSWQYRSTLNNTSLISGIVTILDTISHAKETLGAINSKELTTYYTD